MLIKKSSSRKFYGIGFTLNFKNVSFLILFLTLCSQKKESSFFLDIEKENYWDYSSYRITIFNDGKVYLSTGSFFKKKGKRTFQIKKDIQKKIQNSLIEYIKTIKKEPKEYFTSCYDCIKIDILYFNGFEKEHLNIDESSKEDFIKLEKALEEWENLLGITEEDKQCEDCK